MRESAVTAPFLSFERHGSFGVGILLSLVTANPEATLLADNSALSGARSERSDSVDSATVTP